MKRSVILLFALLLCLVLPTQTEAAELASGTCGDNLTWVLDDTGALTISGTGDMYDYTIGAQPWASYRSAITSLIIEEGITSIGDCAFSLCSGFSGILSIPDTVLKIGKSSFMGCANLTGELVIPEGVTEIGNYTFCDCSGFSGDLNLPSNLKTIGNAAFMGCSGLTGGLVIPDSVTNVGGYSFCDCVGLREITFNGNAPDISSGTFENVTATAYYPADNATWTSDVIQDYGGTITWVAYDDHVHDYSGGQCSCGVYSGTCGENLTWVLDDAGTLTISGEGAMEDYNIIRTGPTAPWASFGENITKVQIGEGVTSVGAFAFALCENVQDVSLPETLVQIQEAAFYQCSALTQILLPEGLEKLGRNAFLSSDLSSIQLGKNLQTIGKNPFGGNNELTEITVADENSWYYAEDNVLFCADTQILICYPAGLTQDSYSVPDGVVSIGEGGFSGNDYIKTIVLADSVTSLESGALSCSSLSALRLSDNLRTIGEVALMGTALEELIIPSSVETIGNSALIIPTLKSVIFTGNAPSIDEDTFGVTDYDAITVTAYYPADNPTWTEEVMQNYGGTITWVPYEVETDDDTGEENTVEYPSGLKWFFNKLEDPDNLLWATGYYARLMEKYGD